MYKEKIYNAQTGEETWRDLTAEEIKEIEAAQKLAKEKSNQMAIIQNNRKSALAKLIDLGLTEEEIAAL